MEESTRTLGGRAERWSQEAAFFDAAAEHIDAAALPVDPLALERYGGHALRRRFSMEYRFKLLGDLKGKQVLDVGCGDGLNLVLFACLGARVTGVDVSAGAIDVARRRAAASGVADRVTLICAPIEEAALAPGAFDVVWGDGILHHVLAELELTLSHLRACVRPGGLLVLSEPVNLNRAVRHVRRMIPVSTDATPGERPLLRSELDLVRRHVPDLRIRYYSLFGRLDRFVLRRYNYERSSLGRRAIAGGLYALDWGLLSVPFLTSLAATCVMYGHPAGAARTAAP